jgi:polysaccharide pyruvyl transferase WcaK-like protein
MSTKYKVIGLMDHMGLGNMGDAAIQEAFIANIRRRVPGVHLINFSLHPVDTKERHHIDSYPIRWSYPGKTSGGEQSADPPTLNQRGKSALKRHPAIYKIAKPVHDFFQELAHLRRSYRIVKSLDLLVMAGGGQLCELWYDLPYNVFKFCVLAKLARKPLFIVGVGADLLKKRSNKFFAKWSVRMADYVSLRSVESEQLVRSLGVKRAIKVCPDPVYGLDVDQYIARRQHKNGPARRTGRSLLDDMDRRVDVLTGTAAESLRADKPRVGINPMGFCDPRGWPSKDQNVYDAYLDKIEQFTLWLLHSGYTVEMFSSDVAGDIYSISDLQSRLTPRLSEAEAGRISFRPLLNLEELLRQIASFDYVVTTKFHGVVFSHMLGKPVTAISYLPKINHLMRNVGHGHYCLEVATFDVESLKERFCSMVAQRDHLKSLFLEKTGIYRNDLRAEFDNVFGARQAPAYQESLSCRPSPAAQEPGQPRISSLAQ